MMVSKLSTSATSARIRTFILFIIVQVAVVNQMNESQDGRGQQNQLLDVRRCHRQTDGRQRVKYETAAGRGVFIRVKRRHIPKGMLKNGLSRAASALHRCFGLFTTMLKTQTSRSQLN